MKCSKIIELGEQCGLRDAFTDCPDREENGECLRHQRELQKLNEEYGCLTVFVKKEDEQK